MSETSDRQEDARVRGQAAYKKGLEFERTFRDVMLTQLGFRTVLHRARRKGRLIESGYEVDLLGTWGSGHFRWVALLGFLGSMYLGLHGIGLLGNETPSPHVTAFRDTFVATTDRILGVASFWPAWTALMTLFLLLWRLGERRQEFWVLVECRSREENVDVDYVHSVIGRSKDVQWHQSETWIVASAGFTPDAVQLASAKNIRCIVFRPHERRVAILNPNAEMFLRFPGFKRSMDPLHEEIATLDLSP